ncbi:hypothetical protein HDU82_004380 [Entophlyctis luteolus]|nr:hypothetical protein HDU82_004380 [Entophlyctis luteolus]
MCLRDAAPPRSRESERLLKSLSLSLSPNLSFSLASLVSLSPSLPLSLLRSLYAPSSLWRERWEGGGGESAAEGLKILVIHTFWNTPFLHDALTANIIEQAFDGVPRADLEQVSTRRGARELLRAGIGIVYERTEYNHGEGWGDPAVEMAALNNEGVNGATIQLEYPATLAAEIGAFA